MAVVSNPSTVFSFIGFFSGGISLFEFASFWQIHHLKHVFSNLEAAEAGKRVHVDKRESLMVTLGLTLTEAELASIPVAEEYYELNPFREWWSKYDVKQLFNTYDVEGDGVMDVEELAILVKNLGLSMSPAQLQECIAKFDVNRDGQLSFEEFYQWWSAHKETR